MAKTYTFEEFKWKFLAREVDRFDLRKPYDVGRYAAYQSLKKTREEEWNTEEPAEEKEVRRGSIVKILRIEDKVSNNNYGSFSGLKKTA
jgi:hypothetical protein